MLERLSDRHHNGGPVVIARQFESDELQLKGKLLGRVMDARMITNCVHLPNGRGFCWDCTSKGGCKNDGKKDRALGREYNTELSRFHKQRNLDMIADRKTGMTYREIGVKYGLAESTACRYVRGK